MPRHKTHVPLNVLINDRLVGRLEKEPSSEPVRRLNSIWR